MNTYVEWFVSQRSNQWMDASPTMNAKTTATPVSPTPGEWPLPGLIASYAPDSTTAGMESRNENRAAASRVRPRNSPAVIVVPERDAPGISARACAVPTARASVVLICSSSRSRRPALSAAYSRQASAISVEAMSQRLRAPVSIWSLKISPNAPTGIVATIRYQPSLYSSVPRTDRSYSPRNQATVTCSNSRQKYRTTATVVPSCTTAVKGAPGSFVVPP